MKTLALDTNVSNGNHSPSLNSNGITAHPASEKSLLARKIREYNRKTTPVHHIHIKSVSTYSILIIQYYVLGHVYVCVCTFCMSVFL